MKRARAIAIAAVLGGCGNDSSSGPRAVDAGTDAPADASLGPWTAIRSVTHENLRAVWSSGDLVVAVGEHATVVTSTDHGGSWRWSVPIPVAPPGAYPYPVLKSAWGASPDAIWVVGDENASAGVVLRSKDRGASWERVDTGGIGAASGIWSSGDNAVYVAGGHVVILSSDGGATWNTVFGDANVYVHGVWGTGPANVYLAASRTDATDAGADAGGSTFGVLYHSSDRGVSWRSVAETPAGALYAVSGTPDGARVRAVGANAAMAWSYDGGKTFLVNGAPGASQLALTSVAVVPDAPDPFVAGAPEGIARVIEPSSGGVDVQAEALPEGAYVAPTNVIGTSASAVFGVRASDVWAAGSFGAIWKRR